MLFLNTASGMLTKKSLSKLKHHDSVLFIVLSSQSFWTFYKQPFNSLPDLNLWHIGHILGVTVLEFSIKKTALQRVLHYQHRRIIVEIAGIVRK